MADTKQSRIAYIVADDVPIVAELVSEMLREAGAEVVGQAVDGLQALRLYHETLPDGAVLDFEMPHANGLEVLRAIRAHRGAQGCRVIMLTSHGDPSLREACLEAGADHFLHKPTELHRLLELVAEHVGGSAGGDGGDGGRSPSTDSPPDI